MMRKLPTMSLALAALAVAAAASGSSCSQTPTNVPIRTFEGAQRAAVVCLQVLNVPDPTHGAIPVTQDNCAPVAAGVVPQTLPYHLVAAVTQTTRGELAIVDLTGGFVVDEDPSTPGNNFIPVGTNPTDVAIPPDGLFTYVASASATKPAIYAIDSRRLLGNSLAAGTPQTPPLQLTDLAACSLPQPPLALAIANLPPGSGTDGGGVQESAYGLVALLGTEGSFPARVVTIDPSSLTNQSAAEHGSLPACTITGGVTLSGELPASWQPGPSWPDGVPYVDGGVDLDGQVPSLGPPGTCSPPVAPTVDAGGAVASEAGAGVPDAAGGVATSDAAGPEDGGPDDAALEDGGTVAATEDAGVAQPGVVDAGSMLAMAADAGAPDAGFELAVAPLSAPNPSSMVMRDDLQLLYVADQSLPLIHVIDLSDLNAPKEIEPLLATSVSLPARPVRVGGLALSPPTRDYKRYLYAIDEAAGSLMVYDVTDGATSPHVPLQRPNPELDPFAPPDRLTFSAPVATMAFVQHDWPLQVPTGLNVPANTSLAYTGLLCNPNPQAHPGSTTFNDLGAFYRVDQAGVIQANGTVENFPDRLRGVFAFATLSNGTVVTIDVDDWDAPCRRPDPMEFGQITGSLDVPEPDAGAGPDGGADLDPYHVPLAYQVGTMPVNSLMESPAVTLEPFFPVSAPHRIRSGVLVRNDPTSGVHIPNLVGTPQLTDVNGTPVATSGRAGVANPLLLPTTLQPGFTDPTTVQNPTEPNPAARITFTADGGTFPDPATSPTPGVRLSFEDPTVTQNQDWTVTYEGVLPSSNGIFANIAPAQPDDYTTLTFTTTGANLCGLGIEDWGIGQLRAEQALRDMKAANLPVSQAENTLPQWTTDYVEITSDILQQGDAYWSLPQACWDIPDTDLADGGTGHVSIADQRYDICQATFGAPGSNPDLNVTRDAPILEAYTDHLQVGRFGHFTNQLETTSNRSVDPGSANNPTFLKLMTCCFNKQASFKVRAGGEWVAVGQQGLGLLNHVKAADPPGNNRCVLSCDPNDSLLNARSFDVPWAAPSTNPSTNCVFMPPPGTNATTAGFPSVYRDDPLAMRNPMFSYVTWAGCGTPMAGSGDHTLTARDLTWKFSVTGGFSPLTIALGGTTGVSVNPQSMLFIPSIGQLAVVDGAEQGLVLIDLNTVAFSTNYF
jgi:hypothetical protein